MSNVKEEPNSSPTNGGGLQGGWSFFLRGNRTDREIGRKGDEEEESPESSNR